MPPYKRRKQLVEPRLQMRLVLTFLGVGLVGLILQFVLFTATISSLASELPNDGPMLVERIPSYTLTVLLISVCVLFPLTITVGILATFRVAGPIYRIHQHLRAIARGEDPGECHLRKGDQLQDLCATLNDAMKTARESGWSVRSQSATRQSKSLDRAA